jgi:DhnA family fructose-bisphosphate aldolase class Ia/Fe-S-cluster-containing hydrogenase component 2
MTLMTSPGKVARLSRIINPADDRAVVIAADHGYMLGPIRGVIDLEATIRSVASGGADGILVSPGQAGKIGHLFRGRGAPGLLVRADWTNAFRSKTYTLPSRHVQHRYMTSPRQALALGADAIVIYFFVGYADDREEAEHVRKVGRFARECDDIGLPFIVEPIPLGERITGANYNELVKISIRMSAEIGADAIKAPYTNDVDFYREVVDSAGIPILILGGAKSKTLRDALEVVEEALAAGATGTVFGRNVIQAPDPGAMVSSICRVVHGRMSAREVTRPKIQGRRVLKVVNAAECTGCRICELACSFTHGGSYDPASTRIHVRDAASGPRPAVCTQCGKCVEACPTSALSVDQELGCIRVDLSLCNRCGDCVEACPLGVIGMGVEGPLICDLCGGMPECEEWCPRAVLATKEAR